MSVIKNNPESNTSVFQRATIHTTCRNYKKASSDDADTEQPIKFSTSRAAHMNSARTFQTAARDAPPYQAPIVATSLAVFLIYFLYLREENDIDIELNKSLYERVPGLEKTQLELSIEYNKKHGKPTEDLERRMAELESGSDKSAIPARNQPAL